jgi:hypothetical protein
MRIRPSRVGSPWFTYHILSLNEQKLLSKGSHELYRSLGFSWALSYFLRRCHGRAFGSMAIRGSSFRTESEGCPFRTIHFHLRGNVEKDLMDSRYYLHTLNFRGPQILDAFGHLLAYRIWMDLVSISSNFQGSQFDPSRHISDLCFPLQWGLISRSSATLKTFPLNGDPRKNAFYIQKTQAFQPYLESWSESICMCVSNISPFSYLTYLTLFLWKECGVNTT